MPKPTVEERAAPVVCPLTGLACGLLPPGLLDEKPRRKLPGSKPARSSGEPRLDAWGNPLRNLDGDVLVGRPKSIFRKWAGVQEWIRNNPNWVAGKLVSQKPSVVYFSYYYYEQSQGGFIAFNWALKSRRKKVKSLPEFEEYPDFDSWKKAEKEGEQDA